MCAYAIDFGKHGKKYVPSENLKWYNKVISTKGYPDFMEKTDKKSRESKGVLGQLYRNIKDIEDAALNSFIRLDYEKSILLQYELDATQVAYAKQTPSIFQHLDTVYSRIVRPMEVKLQQLVIAISICSEAEIFASNIQFKVFQ